MLIILSTAVSYPHHNHDCRLLSAPTTTTNTNYTPWVQVRAVAALVVARHQFRQWDPATEHGRKLLQVSPGHWYPASSICVPPTLHSYITVVTIRVYAHGSNIPNS